MERIGIIGLGRMGSALAKRFVSQGTPVVGWTRSDLSAERAGALGISSAQTLDALTARADVLISSLYDDEAVDNVLGSLAQVELAGRLLIETSTITPATLQGRSHAIEHAGGALVDAPIAGGPELVAAGKSGIFVGGADEAAARALAALAPITERRVHVGPLGAGLTMKCINNSLGQIYMAGLCAQLRLAKRAGMSLAQVMEILMNGPVALPLVADRLSKILGQDRGVGFPVTGLQKDNAVFQRILREHAEDPKILAPAQALFDAAIAAGLGEQDPGVMIANAYHSA